MPFCIKQNVFCFTHVCRVLCLLCESVLALECLKVIGRGGGKSRVQSLMTGISFKYIYTRTHTHIYIKSSQVITLPIAKSQTRSKQNKGMHKCSSMYSERGVLFPVLTSGGE